MFTLLIPLLKKQALTRSWDILRLLLHGFYPAYIIIRTMQRRSYSSHIAEKYIFILSISRSPFFH